MLRVRDGSAQQTRGDGSGPLPFVMGSGTGQTLPLWAGVGPSTTLTDSAASQTATELIVSRAGRFTVTDALPAAVSIAMTLRHDPGGAGAAGVGVSETYQTRNGVGTFVDVAQFAATLTSVGAGTENGVFDVILRVAGTLRALWRYETDGALRASRGANRRVYLQGYTTAAGAPPPESFSFEGQTGAPATVPDPPTDGGDVFLLGGVGGAGNAFQIGGFGGNAVILGRAPGADGGAGQFDSGSVFVDVQPVTTGVPGQVYIGTGLAPGAGSQLPALVLVGHTSTAMGSVPVLLRGIVASTIQNGAGGTVLDAHVFERESTGVVVAGIGVGLKLRAANTGLGVSDAAQIAAIATIPLFATYTTRIAFSPSTAGSLVERMSLALGLAVGSTTDPGLGRLSTRGSTLVVGDVVRGAGWGGLGASHTVSGDDTHGTVTITAGAAPAVNPTFTLTFHDGTWTVAPFPWTKMGGATTSAGDIAIPVTETVTATTMVVTWWGTPVPGNVYEIKFWCIGRGA